MNYEFIKYCLFPNQTSIYLFQPDKEYIMSDINSFRILLYPVYKLLWRYQFLCIKNNIITLNNNSNERFDINNLIDVNITFTDEYVQLTKQFQVINCTYEAYAYFSLTLYDNNNILLQSLSQEQIFGIVESATKLGIITSKKKSNIDPAVSSPFTYSKITFKSLDIHIQYKIFKIWINRSICTITGATGVGKTSQIPKLFWWFNYLFDGYEQFSTPCNNDYLNYIFNKKLNKSKYTLLSMPRKALIRQMGMTFYKSLGFKSINNSPVVMKYKDVKTETDNFNENPPPYNNFIIAVNRLTINLLHNTNTIIFDEVHEHDKYADIGIAICKIKKYEFKIRNIVLMSATLEYDYTNILNYFGNNIININISGTKLFPIEVIVDINDRPEFLVNKYLPPIGYSVIFFFESITRIETAYNYITKLYKDSTTIKIYKIHSKILDINNIIQALQSDNKHIHIILATNILESSITVTNAIYIIDNGLRYVKMFLTGGIRYITKSMADQRRGRVGRVGPGIYIQCYDKYKLEPEYNNIDYDYLWSYIITFKFFKLDIYKDLFIKPADMYNRLTKSIKYLNSIGLNLDHDISDIYIIYSSYECNMIEYIPIYKKIISPYMKTSMSLFDVGTVDYGYDRDLTILLKSINVLCTVTSIKKTLKNTIYTFKIDKYPDGILTFKVHRLKPYNIKLQQKMLLIHTRPLTLIHINKSTT